MCVEEPEEKRETLYVVFLVFFLLSACFLIGFRRTKRRKKNIMTLSISREIATRKSSLPTPTSTSASVTTRTTTTTTTTTNKLGVEALIVLLLCSPRRSLSHSKTIDLSVSFRGRFFISTRLISTPISISFCSPITRSNQHGHRISTAREVPDELQFPRDNLCIVLPCSLIRGIERTLATSRGHCCSCSRMQGFSERNVPFLV